MDIFAIPPEILPGIVKFMRPEDITHFRLTCWQFHNENAFLMVWVSKVNFCHILRKKKVSYEFLKNHIRLFLGNNKKCTIKMTIWYYFRYQRSPVWYTDKCIKKIKKMSTDHFQCILNVIYCNQFIPEEIIERYIDKFTDKEWLYIFKCQNISEAFIEKHVYEVNWDYVFFTKLSEEFIEKHADKCDRHPVRWEYITEHQKLSPQFIDKYADKLTWYDPGENVCRYQTLTEELIEKYIDRVNWFDISRFQKLSESFIENHSHDLYWSWVSKKQTLSESFIDKHSNSINWYWASLRQKLSEKFIEDHAHLVDWPRIFRRNDLSDEFRLKWAHEMYTRG